MDGRAIDHVNLQIPNDRIDEAVEFYREGLGFAAENLEAYRAGDRPLFSFRISDSSVIHISPVEPEEFEPPARVNYDHFAVVLQEEFDTIEATIADAGIEVRRTSNPLGATGRNRAAYVEDPFGYVIELKSGV